MSYANNCEAYTTGAVTVSNSDDNGAGTAFTSISDGGTAANVSYSASAGRYGSAGIRLAIANGQTTTRFLVPNGSAVTGRFAIYGAFKVAAVPTVRGTIMHIRNASTNACHLCIDTDGKLMMTNTSDSGVALSKPASAILANHWYGICLVCAKGTGTGDGTIGYRWYDLTDNSTLHTYEFATYNTGTLDMTTGGYGRHTTSGDAATLDFDDVRGEPTASGYLTPSAAVAPVAALADNRGVITSSGGTGPFTITQDSGTTTTPTEVDDGAVSGTGMWLVAKHASDTLVYTVTDSLAADSNQVSVPSIPSGTSLAAGIKMPSTAPPGSTWE